MMQDSDTFRKVGSGIGRKIKSINDEIKQGINAILQGVNLQNKTQLNPTRGENVMQDNEVIEFNEDKEEDILPQQIELGLEDIVDMLEARYNIVEIEAMTGVQLELDDSLQVKLVRPLFFFQQTMVLFIVVI